MKKRLLGVFVTAVWLLSSCAIPVPQPSENIPLERNGALTPQQSDLILDDTHDLLAAADSAKNSALLTARVSGDAAAIRQAEYRVDKAGAGALSVIPRETLAVYGTAGESWPRTMVVVTEEVDAQSTPLVMMWVQDNVEDNYELRNWASMLPGGVMPAMPSLSVGASQMSLDASGLVMTPGDALDLYVKILNEGSSSESADAFAPDGYRDRMFSARAALVGTAKARGGTYTDVVKARPEETFVFLTDEGDALLLAPITITSTFSVPGAQLTLPKRDSALFSGTLRDRAVYTYRDFIVFRVPVEGSEVLPEIIAADHFLTAVKTK